MLPEFMLPELNLTETAVTVVNAWISAHPSYDLEVVFSCLNQKNYNLVKERMGRLAKGNTVDDHFEDEKKNSKTLMNNFFCCMQRDIFKLSAYYTYLIKRKRY